MTQWLRSFTLVPAVLSSIPVLLRILVPLLHPTYAWLRCSGRHLAVSSNQGNARLLRPILMPLFAILMRSISDCIVPDQRQTDIDNLFIILTCPIKSDLLTSLVSRSSTLNLAFKQCPWRGQRSLVN